MFITFAPCEFYKHSYFLFGDPPTPHSVHMFDPPTAHPLTGMTVNSLYSIVLVPSVNSRGDRETMQTGEDLDISNLGPLKPLFQLLGKQTPRSRTFCPDRKRLPLLER